LELVVENTIKDPTGLIIHKGRVISGRIEKGQVVTLSVDGDKRGATALNHTATHLLHAALRKVLGDHVKQAGSMVAPDRLRFDFTHFSHIPPEQLEQIETIVNEQIRANSVVHTDEMDAEDARQSGAMALFEEKYGDRVRVVSLADFSKELCGGTHTQRTGDIGLFKILSETSVASGVRRIEALTGVAALNHAQQSAQQSQQISLLLRAKPEEAVQRVQQLLTAQKTLEKEIEKLKAALADAQSQSEADDVRQIKGVDVLVKQVIVDTPAALRDLADRYRDRVSSGIVVLGSAADAKALLIVIVTKDLVKRFHAGQIVKALSAIVGGGGGGRPDMAQAGGSQPQNLPAALAKAYDVIEGMAE
jgi:alanyl-tRNA synthetase